MRTAAALPIPKKTLLAIRIVAYLGIAMIVGGQGSLATQPFADAGWLGHLVTWMGMLTFVPAVGFLLFYRTGPLRWLAVLAGLLVVLLCWPVRFRIDIHPAFEDQSDQQGYWVLEDLKYSPAMNWVHRRDVANSLTHTGEPSLLVGGWTQQEAQQVAVDAAGKPVYSSDPQIAAQQTWSCDLFKTKYFGPLAITYRHRAEKYATDGWGHTVDLDGCKRVADAKTDD